MRTVYQEEIKEKLEFIERAAARFAAEPQLATYTDGPIQPGCYFAVRWGLGHDCVLLLQLDGAEEPELYGQAIPTSDGEPPWAN